ncbi:MAG: MBL fold metallo-hydrolase [Anaerolineales bacterium]|nr:MBL fold metallo-hydrolase [Anaerolineales bacterium]
MEITWYGLSSFRIMERGQAAVVTDPFSDDCGYQLPKPRADIVTISVDNPLHNNIKAVKSPKCVLTGPGEYEIGGVFVTGFSSAQSKKKLQNIIYLFDYGEITICHLGSLDHVPDQSLIEELGTVNILLTPVGGNDKIKPAQTAEIISLLEPNIVVPMHYHVPPTKEKLVKISPFLKEMGTEDVESVDILKVTKTSLPDETQIVLLTL